VPLLTRDREIFDAMAAGIWVVDAHGLTEYVNRRMASMLGYTPAEMLGTEFLGFVAEDLRESVRGYLERCRHDGLGHTDLPLRSREGTLLWLIASTHSEPVGSGQGPCLVCIMTDITERKRLEESLRKTEGHYRVLAETAEDHIFVINRDDRVEFVNKAAARQLRSVPEEVIGRRRVDIFPPEVAERQGRGLQHVFNSGKPLYVEGRTFYLDREVWLSTWLAPVPGDEGEVRAVLGLSRDMTENKQAEDALRASEQRQRVVLSNVPLILWATDAGGVATFCAGRALEALGATPDAIIGHTFDEIGIEPFSALTDDLRRALAGENVSGLVDVGDATFEAWAVPLRDEQNQIDGATGVIVDITERRRLELELSNAQKLEAIGRLAGGIAHDFNNNLTAILGYVEIVLPEVGIGTPTARHLGEVQQAAERAAGLVRRLLAFGRRQVLQTRILSLNHIVEGLMPMLERLIGEPIEVRVNLDPNLPPVTGDGGELEQVIMNLALNARDAMPGGGTLTIETSAVASGHLRPAMPPEPHVLLTVRDTGTGMAPHVKEHVFEPFFTTKAADQGTGLGLSTVYGIVKQLSGFIWVESEVSRGSAFHVYLPVAHAGAAQEASAEESAAPPVRGRREVVLLVEDEHAVRRFARLALEHYGFSVIEAATPEDALALAGTGEHAFSLLLTDVVMPRISGPELAKRLKEIRPELPVLYMSGYPATLVRQDGLIAPDMRLISKPFTAAELVANVGEVLGR